MLKNFYNVSGGLRNPVVQVCKKPNMMEDSYKQVPICPEDPKESKRKFIRNLFLSLLFLALLSFAVSNFWINFLFNFSLSYCFKNFQFKCVNYSLVQYLCIYKISNLPIV